MSFFKRITGCLELGLIPLLFILAVSQLFRVSDSFYWAELFWLAFFATGWWIEQILSRQKDRLISLISQRIDELREKWEELANDDK